MNPQEFIASGILEKYILGLASAEEQREVDRFVQEYPEVRTEMEAIERAMENYLNLHKVKTPDGVEEEVLKRIATDPGVVSTKMDQNMTRSFNWAAVLLGGLFLAAVAGLVWLNQSNNELQASLDQLNAQMQTLQSDCDSVRTVNQDFLQKIQILQNIDNQPTYMRGTPKAPQAIAVVYWNQQTQKSYLNPVNLSPPPPGQQYQLWAIVDGNPVDMGVFDLVVGGLQLQEVPFISNPQAFAITLEPEGGNPSPTLEEMVVIGNVS